MMQTSLRVACLLLCFCHVAFSQDGAPSARKFDEFGDVLPTDMAARLDNFAIELQQDPSARGFMLVYRSHRDLPGLSNRHVNWMHSYLVHSRGMKPDRIVAVDGGTATCLWHELWLVPPGGVPQPRPDAYSRGFEDTDVARKYDEYHYTIAEDMLISFSSEYEGGLTIKRGEGFVLTLSPSSSCKSFPFFVSRTLPARGFTSACRQELPSAADFAVF